MVSTNSLDPTAATVLSMGKSAKDLPFFAKCSLLNLQRDLVGRGHRVSFGKV